MHVILLSLHSSVRWLLLVALVYTIYRGYIGVTKNKLFTKTDNAFRHWTATLAHIQLIIGILLYSQSSIIKNFWGNTSATFKNLELIFYGLIHISLMLIAIVILTIGSALTKRKATDYEKFKTLLIWFTIALIIIFISIPWPFSPLASRPNFRPF